jgi:hypothetical protein
MALDTRGVCSRCSPLFASNYIPSSSGRVLTTDFKWQEIPKIEGNKLNHYDSFLEFQQSAASGCPLCLRFLYQIPAEMLALMQVDQESGGVVEITNNEISTGLFDVCCWYPFPRAIRRAVGSSVLLMTVQLNIPQRKFYRLWRSTFS